MYDMSMNSIAIDNMSGEEFEKICAEMLSRNGFDKVELTPAKGDHGVDITAWKNHKKYAIQCKRYSGNVGNKAVQEVYSGKRIYAASDAIVITNSYFTKQAIEDAEDLGVILWDRDKLLDQIELAGISLNHIKSSVDDFSQNPLPEITSPDIRALDTLEEELEKRVLESSRNSDSSFEIYTDELTISDIIALDDMEEKLEKRILESSDENDNCFEIFLEDNAKTIIQQLDRVSFNKIGQYVNLAYKKQIQSVINVIDGAIKPITPGQIIQDTNDKENPIIKCIFYCNIKNNDEERIQFDLTYALKDLYYEKGVLRVDRLTALKCSRINKKTFFSDLHSELDDLSREIISLLKTNISAKERDLDYECNKS